MTLTLIPFHLDDDTYRTTPRVANLSARGGLREAHWRRVRRRLDPFDVTPLPEEAVESWVERTVGWYFARRWPAIALLVIGCACLGAAVVAATWMLQ